MSPCVLCGATAPQPLQRRGLRHLQRCDSCGLVSVRHIPGPSELREVYSEEYFRNAHSHVSGYEDYASDRYCILKTAHRRLDLIERQVSVRGRLLDVGCALGFFLEAAMERGWQVEGIDISAHAADYATHHLGIDVRCGMLEEAGFPASSFDVLTAWDVVEHVPDPVEFLRTCHDLLRPGGLMVLTTPDVGSLVAKLTGPRWMGFKLAEEHLYYFSRQTLAVALRNAGFKPNLARPVGKDISLEFFAQRLQMYAPWLARPMGRAVWTVGLDRASVYVNPRDILLMVARRPSPQAAAAPSPNPVP